MSRDWRLIGWGANAGAAVIGIILGIKTGDLYALVFEYLMLGLSAYILHDTLTEKSK